MSPLMEAALAYAARGWLVFPCHNILPDLTCSCRNPDCNGKNRGKHPRVTWKTAKTLDRKQIAEWWRQWPAANVAVATGPESGIFVLDVDPDNGGVASFEHIMSGHAAFPPTFVVNTGSGGWHFYFSWPNDGRTITNRVSLADGIDVRGAGGYVVAPPSNHWLGGFYVDRTRIH